MRFVDEGARVSALTERPPRSLRIAQIAPLFEAVPPKLYGGTERVVSWLTEELVRRGHAVERAPAWTVGRLTAAERSANGLLRAAATPRLMQAYAAGR